jgi:tight adherence protein C
VLVDTLRMIGEAVPSTAKRGDPVAERLLQAGYRSIAGPAVFNGIRLAAAVIPGLIGAWVAMANQDGSLSAALLAGICFGGFGYMVPDRVLDRLISKRRKRLRRGLPTALDLLVLAVEAGQTLDQASVDLSRQLRRTFPDLALEFSFIHMELRTGTSRVEALRHFGARNGEAELRKLASLLIDGDRFGANLAPTLRTHAKYMRIRMRQQAQERARKIGVKLVFPLVFLIFPALLLTTLGPAVCQMIGVLGDALNGF